MSTDTLPPVKKIEAEVPKGTDPNAARVQALNERYAFALVGGKQCILEETGDDHELIDVDSWRGLLRKEPPVLVDPIKEKYKPLADYWLAHRNRRTYRRIIFDPSGKPTLPDQYNIWRGWAVQPSAHGSCDKFLAHLKDNVAQGDDAIYRWILGHFAQWVQQPTVKLGISIALRGSEGTGKSIVGKALKLLFGKHHVEVNNPKHVTGTFNSHLRHCLLLQAEEAFWAGNKEAENTLKDLISNHTRMLEYKGKDPIEVANYTRLLITSNSEWVVPVSLRGGGRRYAIFDVGEAQRENHEYFGALEDQLVKDGGAAKLLHTLLTFDLKSVELRKIPETAARREQKLHGLDALESWWYEVLDSGTLPTDWNGEGTADRERLHEHFVRAAKDTGHSRRSSQSEFGMFLHKWVPHLKSHRPGTTDRRRQYSFPSLAECRQEFVKRLGSDPWPEAATWAKCPAVPDWNV
jgi:hypothetical protein